MSQLPFPRPFAAAFDRTPCVLLNNHRITRARFPCSALRNTESLPVQPFSSISFDPLALTSVVGPPPSSSLFELRWSLERRHIYLLNLIACSVAISTAWLFFSAIPALLAVKEAAESLEKLLDVTAEELPDAMAAVRLSGMEITDLTTELSDLGQEITDVVRSSTRVIRTAEDRLQYFTTVAPAVSMQVQDDPSNKTDSPMVAKTAKNMREGIAKGRIVFGVLISVMKFSRWTLKFLGDRRKKKLSV